MQNIRERKKKERNKKKKRKERRKRKRSCIIHNAIDALKLGYWFRGAFRFYTSLTVCNSPDVIGNKAKRLYLEYYYVRV